MMRGRIDLALRLAGLAVLLGAAGVLIFGTVHALAIVPIWRRLAGGLLFAIVAALAVTWAFHTLERSGRWPLTPGAGLRFGALCWVGEVPATLFVNGMRLAAAPASRPEWVDPVSVLLAAFSGATLFGMLGRSWRAALAGAVAIGVLLAVSGGVVPVVNSRRAAGLWVGFLVVEAGGGVLLALGYRWLVAAALPESVGPTAGQGHAA